MPQLTPQQPPPPDYYAANLRLVLDHVRDAAGHLLRPAEQRFIETVLDLDTDAQRLYARLLSRKGPWIRLERLDYREIADVCPAVERLTAVGLIHLNPPAPADALLMLLTDAERRAAFPDVTGANRGAWIERCVGRYPDARIRTRLACRHPWLSLQGAGRMRLCELLFFGDDRQDLSTFVLQDLGVRSFESYPLRPDRGPFRDRDAVERFRRLRALSGLSHRLDELPELAPWLAEALWCAVGTRVEQRQRDRILNRLGRWQERRGAFDEALDCYARSESHPGRERRVRLLARLGDDAGASDLVARMRARPRCAEEADFSTRFGTRRRREAFATTELPLTEAPGSGIEAHAAALLGAGGAAVFHLENAFSLGLAGLAFWDVVFDDVPGAFSNPFQAGPLDLFWPDFAAARQERLDARVTELRAPGALGTALRRTYEAKCGIANRLVSWRHFTPDVLEAALQNVPAAALLDLAQFVIRWPYRTRNGFPDLVVIYGPDNYEYVEVKGPTDQLQPAQRVWLRSLEALGQPARVLKFKAC